MLPDLTKNELLTMAGELPTVPKYVLNPYRMPDKFREEDSSLVARRPYTMEEIRRMAEEIRHCQPGVVV